MKWSLVAQKRTIEMPEARNYYYDMHGGVESKDRGSQRLFGIAMEVS